MASNYTVLLVGNGGREHAIAWKLSQSPKVSHIYVCPGNGGTQSLPKTTNITSVSEKSFSELVTFAEDKSINILIPGPEAPLVGGIVNYFQDYLPHVLCFGPTRKAAEMEGSKAFSKDFMMRQNIPTAAYESFSDYQEAVKYIKSIDHDVVIKASGLAAGKGVVIPESKAHALAELEKIMIGKIFETAGDTVVIEELLRGHEISILSFSDGKTIKSLPPAQDHKRIFDGDKGPNTGGMGTYAPAPNSIVSEAVLREIDAQVLLPTIQGMSAEGFPFVGCLFTGFMLTEAGPKLLEYNVRFGDPETQSLMVLLETDLIDLIVACAQGKLEEVDLKVASGKSAATVVVAAAGYPEKYDKDIVMQLDSAPEDVVLFHAGTKVDAAGQLKTNGGRVIASTATGQTLESAIEKAYQGVGSIHFKGMQYRKDIGARALK